MTGTTENNEMKRNGILSSIICFFHGIKRRTIIDIVIIAIPVLLIYFYFNTRTPDFVKDTAEANKKIEQKVDSLKSDNEFIVGRMYDLEKNQIMFFDLINQNNDLIKENNKRLIKLQKIYNEKINSVNGYNISQLDSFFTNRYAEYYNR